MKTLAQEQAIFARNVAKLIEHIFSTGYVCTLGDQDPVLQNDRARVIKNSAKPRPLASVNPQQGDSPLSKANAFANGEFTEADRKRAWAEMVAARKNM